MPHLFPVSIVATLLGLCSASITQAQSPSLITTGAMRNTIFNGQLAGLISMDTLARKGIYGLGPLEGLRGEVLVADGHVFVSEVAKDGTMNVIENAAVRAPFFVHAHVRAWDTVPLPSDVTDLPTLDAWLTKWVTAHPVPFVFRLITVLDSADFHVMDLPPGISFSGPDEAHAFAKTFTVQHTSCELIGFFSTHHKGVFTHHDSNIHVHLISANHQQMGHLETLNLASGSRFLLIGR